MIATITFRPSSGAVVRSILFVVGSGMCLLLTGLGLLTATGPTLLVLSIASLFPFLITVAAMLLMLVVLSRRIELDGSDLVHRQVFKNHTIPLSAIRRVELRRNEEGRVDTMKLFWAGKTLYVDAKAVGGFEQLVREVLERTRHAVQVEVEAFHPSAG